MQPRLKPVEEQVIVITGASSGIGLTTARAAARRGARLVLAARNEEALRRLCDEINAAGGEAVYVTTDVGRLPDVLRLADAAHERFGGFDTWVNDAAVAIYGKLAEVSLDDMHRLFDTNFWGVVHGSLVAAERLRDRGGAIINIGSVLSDVAMPLQGIYSASKHAVKGFTDALRMELEQEGAPIAVTLIKPHSINTPYPEHAKNYTEQEPTVPPPVYAPDVVADAILHCAERPTRDLYVGSAAKMMASVRAWAPRIADRMAEAASASQQTGRPAANHGGNLYEPGEDLRERSSQRRWTRERSYYTQASIHPLITAGVAVGVGVALAAAVGAALPSRPAGSSRPPLPGRGGLAGDRRLRRWEQEPAMPAESDPLYEQPAV